MPNFTIHGPSLLQVNDGQDAISQPALPSALKKKGKPKKPVLVQPLTRVIRDASNILLSLRDGMTESEREGRRRVEERMQILAARMQNVRRHTRPFYLLVGLLLTAYDHYRLQP